MLSRSDKPYEEKQSSGVKKDKTISGAMILEKCNPGELLEEVILTQKLSDPWLKRGHGSFH